MVSDVECLLQSMAVPEASMKSFRPCFVKSKLQSSLMNIDKGVGVPPTGGWDRVVVQCRAVSSTSNKATQKKYSDKPHSMKIEKY